MTENEGSQAYMKKSVCIITWARSNNYGSNLQALGLAKTLEALGYDVYFMHKFRVKSFYLKHPTLLFSRVLNKINKKRAKAFFTPVPYIISEERTEKMNRFREEHYKYKSYYTSDSWQKDIDDGIVFICGSDIIWNPARGYPALNFADIAYFAKLNRFSYASSVGAQELPKKYYRAYRRYLGSMKEIGVREQVVADMLEPIIGRKPTKVVDPSLLLTAEQWDELADHAELSVTVDPNGFVLCYYVMNDPRYWDYVKKVEDATGLQIIVLPMHEMDETQPYSIVLDGTPCEFLWLIKHACFICTDSFHACVASMIYHKEFYLLPRTRKAENAKYDDFLTRYQLTSQKIEDESSFIRRPEIDYGYADEQLKKDRAFSLEFIREALNEC